MRIDVWDPARQPNGVIDPIAIRLHLDDIVPCFGLIDLRVDTRVMPWAKALVRGVVEIDSEAGPSEVVVIADETANPAHAAAELLAQAEHDEEATSVLITPSRDLAEAVRER